MPSTAPARPPLERRAPRRTPPLGDPRRRLALAAATLGLGVVCACSANGGNGDSVTPNQNDKGPEVTQSATPGVNSG